MKKVKNSELSDRKCKDCGKPLKQNLTNKNPDADRCYVCWRVAEGRISTRKDYKDVQRKQKTKYLHVL